MVAVDASPAEISAAADWLAIVRWLESSFAAGVKQRAQSCDKPLENEPGPGCVVLRIANPEHPGGSLKPIAYRWAKKSKSTSYTFFLLRTLFNAVNAL